MVLSMLVIFTFVALWHDLSFKLLAWGWLVVIFIIPELIAVYFLPATKVCSFFWSSRPELTFVLCSTADMGGIDTYALSARYSIFL